MSAATTTIPDTNDPPHAKQPRIESAQLEQNQQQHDFAKFHLCEVLDNSPKAKYVSLLGQFAAPGGDGDKSDSAVLLLEKEPFPSEELQLLVEDKRPLSLLDNEANNKDSSTVVMHNDVWHKYRLRLSPAYAFAKATLIHPATQRLINKYRRRPTHLVTETPEDFRLCTEPALSEVGARHSLTWVRNLLDGSAERDRLVHEDANEELGYVLHADLKWDGRRMDDLYCLAVCRRDGLHSLRQLGPEHLPMLVNLLDGGRAAITARYGVPASQLRVFLHYQPSFYHLHAHFTHVAADWPGQQAERAHLLTSVIDNIRLLPDYYQKATLTFPLKEGDALFDAYKHKLG